MRLAVLCAAAVALWAAFFGLTFAGWMSDPIWYLEPARAVYRGMGVVTRIMLPAQVAGFPQGFLPPVPFLHHGPVAPLLYGGAYLLLGFSDGTPYAVACLFTLLSGLLAYWLARRLAGEKEALTAAALFFVHPIILEANIMALTDAPFILFIGAAFAALWLSQKDRRWLLASGALLGLASTTRLAGQTYWPGFLFAVWWLHRDAKALGLFAGALFVSLIPLFAYNHAAAGIWLYSPGFYALNWSPSFPGFRSSTTYMNLTSAGALLAYPLDFAQKSVTGPLYAVRRFLAESYAPWTMACVAFGLLSIQTGPAERFRKLTLCVALPVMLANAVLSYGPVHYLDALFPMFMVLGALWLWRWPGKTAVFLLLAALSSTALWVKDEWKSAPERRASWDFHEAVGEFVKSSTRPQEVLYTDSNRMIVWNADRIAVSLPATVEDARKTFAHLPPDALVLTSNRIDSPDYDDVFREAYYQGAEVFGFRPCRTLNHGASKAILLRRKGACG